MLFLVLVLLPLTAIAQTSNNITINGTVLTVGTSSSNSDEGWIFSSNKLTLSGTDKSYTLSGTDTSEKISVSIEANCNVTLDNLTLTHGDFEVKPSNSVNLYIKGSNSLENNYYSAGLSVPEKASITIDTIEGYANATLSLQGGTQSAGLGSSNGKSNKTSGSITINGGTINAKGNSAAGIGGNSSGNNGTITINGGNVTARGASYASAIGGGFMGNGGTININGGNVTATGGRYGAAIGGGSQASGGNITISGGTVKAISGGRYSYGIGDGNEYSGTTNASIVIKGGSVETPSFNGSEPTNGTNKVYKVLVPFLEKNSKASIDFGGAFIFGQTDIMSDSEGNLYLYLVPNTYSITVTDSKGKNHYNFKVDGTSDEVIATKAVAISGSSDNDITNATGVNVVLERGFNPWGWNTLVLPFDLTTNEVNETFGKSAKVAYFTNNTENTIELNTDENSKAITANKPVLISGLGWGIDWTFKNKDIKASSTPQIEGAKGINFVGTYKNMTVAAGDYFIAQDTTYTDKLWKSTGKTTLAATRAYFTVTDKKNAKPRLLIVNGETTGIVTPIVNEDAKVKDSTVYNLGGQKVGDSNSLHSLPKGVYIVGRKKIVIK